MTEKEIIAVADPHLGSEAGDAELMVKFIESLDPERVRLLFLGDLFQIWAAPAKYRAPKVKTVLRALQTFRERGGKVHLTAGNRDMFCPETRTAAGDLPFDSISREAAFLFLRGEKIMAVHGDTVNSLDKRYLRWRKLVRHPFFKFFFDLLPAGWTQKIMLSLEDKLKHTNVKFRREFPWEEWEKFIEKAVGQSSPRMLLAGHFHPPEPIISRRGQMSAIVLPDWRSEHIYMRIDPDLKYAFPQYSPDFQERPARRTQRFTKEN